ncbi:hypothetical protein TKK_0009906 [Trichogramma kaykai]
MSRLIRYPNERGRTSYFHNGYMYHCEHSRNPRIFRCIKRTSLHCPGKVVVVDEDLNIDETKTKAHHGHDQDLYFLEKLAFKRELFRRCQETREGFMRIFHDMSDEFPRVAVFFQLKSLYSSMYNYRRLNVPPMPENLQQLAEVIGQFDPIVQLYKGHCTDDNGGIALMFMHPEMRGPLSECTALFGDGTFKIRPRNPRDIAQVYTFHLTKNLSGFPAIYFLTNARTADLYKAMLRKMVEVIPSLAHNLTAVSTDFERSIITAVREVFPNARLSGCLFHYKQALRRYWYWKCHIPENFQEILEYAMALAYLPAYDMETGFNVVMGLMNYHNVPNAVRFSNYFRRQWLPLANVVSVYGRRIRTNNICENFHLHAKTYIGVRQGLWLMLERLAKLAKIFVNRYNTAVQSGILFWSWPAELLRANRDLNAMEPTLPEIGVRNYLEFVVRQRRARFLPEYDNDNQDENPPDDEDDNLVAELNHNGIGLNVFIAQDEIAPIQVRIQDLPDDAEHNNPFAPNPRGRGRGRGRAARGARGRGRGTRGGAGGRGRAGGAAAARGARGRVGRGRGRGRAELPPVEADIIEDEQPLAEVDDFELHEDLAVVVREPLGGAGVEALPLPQEPRAVPVQAAVVAVEPPVEENQAERDALLEDRLENFPPGQELLAPLVPVGAVVVEPSGTNGEEGEQDALQDPQVPELETVPSHEAAVDGFPRIENPQAQPENESQIPAQQEDLHTRLKANNKIQ